MSTSICRFLLIVVEKNSSLSWVPGGGVEARKMGDLRDPIDGGTLVPYFWPYFVGIFPEI